jgi:Leucine-rich repeat (LRR) protein
MVFIAWATCFFFYAAHFVAASQSSALQLEANAMLASGWWKSADYTNNTSSRCEWPTITCNSAGSVTYIVMSRSALGGEMSKLNLSCFPNLVLLDLYGNELNGSIPVEIGTLSKLTYLDLSYNTLTGTIPSTLGNLTNLKVLYLDFNQINGFIPPELGNMKNLTTLSLSNNSLIGPIPFALGHLTNLKKLYLHFNQINGSIPPELGNLHLLEYLNLSHNFISGEAPVELGSIDYLQSLDISYNNLTGNIPNSYSSIETISLSYNSLTGSIPTDFVQYHTPDTLIGNKYLCGNFTGFPPCLPTRNKSIVTKAKICVPIAISLGFLVLGGFLLCRRMVKKPQFESRK